MNYDQFGQCWTTPEELFEMLYQTPDLNLEKFLVKPDNGNVSRDIFCYNNAVTDTYADLPKLKTIKSLDCTVEMFDSYQQTAWHMPDEYKELDIAQWVLGQCKTEPELQRVGQELLLFQERDAFSLLKYLKYLVDTLRANNIVWGLGRGSSVASYVLYLIGVHKIDSIYYDLPIEEFLK